MIVRESLKSSISSDLVVADGDVTEEQLDGFCLASKTLARFKRPREYRFVSELPKSPSGKILRRMLRDE